MEPDDSGLVLFLEVAADGIASVASELFEAVTVGEDGITECMSCEPALRDFLNLEDNLCRCVTHG